MGDAGWKKGRGYRKESKRSQQAWLAVFAACFGIVCVLTAMQFIEDSPLNPLWDRPGLRVVIPAVFLTASAIPLVIGGVDYWMHRSEYV